VSAYRAYRRDAAELDHLARRSLNITIGGVIAIFAILAFALLTH
jgi:hypothetical protein